MASGHKNKEIWFQTTQELPIATFLGISRVRHKCMAAVSLVFPFLAHYSLATLASAVAKILKAPSLPRVFALPLLLVRNLSLPCLFPFLQLTSSPKFFLVHLFQSNLHFQALWSLPQLPLPRQQEPCLSVSLSFLSFKHVGSHTVRIKQSPEAELWDVGLPGFEPWCQNSVHMSPGMSTQSLCA